MFVRTKTIFLSVLGFAMLAIGAIPVLAEQDLTKAFDTYLELSESLSADNRDKSLEDFKTLIDQSEGDKSLEALTVSDASSLKELRGAFAELSEVIIPIFEEKLPDLVKQNTKANCPMARDGKPGSWLQRGKEIRNPYFGSEMLSCGSVVE